MHCDDTAELLPWYLNQSLTDPEREQIDRHLASCDACRAELAEAETAFSLFGGHLPAAALVEYVFEAPETAVPRDVVEAHLAGCRRCRAELALVTASRHELDAEIAAGNRLDSAWAIALERPPAPRVAAGWRVASLAASVAFVALAGLWLWSGPLGLARDPEGIVQRLEELQRRADELAGRVAQDQGQILRLEERVAELSAPRLGVPIVDLWPEAVVLRGDAGPESGVLERRGPSATLILNSELASGTTVVRLEIRAGETVLYVLDDIDRDPAAGLTLSLPLRDLPVGPLQIALFGASGGEPVERFDFELR